MQGKRAPWPPAAVSVPQTATPGRSNRALVLILWPRLHLGTDIVRVWTIAHADMLARASLHLK